MNKNNFLLILAVLVPCILNAFPYGYKRLTKEGVTVTLVYDTHELLPGTSVEEMNRLPFDQAKTKLFASELRFIEALEWLNMLNEPTDIIWEAYPDSIPAKPTFLQLAPQWIRNQFRNLRFIYADRQRVSFDSLFFLKGQLPNYMEATPDDLLPFSRQRLNELLNNYNEVIWYTYKRLYENTKRELENQFRDHLRTRNRSYDSDALKQLLNKCKARHDITNLEILYHIITSKARKIIVYAGGFHCEKITRFLCEHAGFTFAGEKGCKEWHEGTDEQYEDRISSALIKRAWTGNPYITPPLSLEDFDFLDDKQFQRDHLRSRFMGLWH